jgi:cysteine dioxygenase
MDLPIYDVDVGIWGDNRTKKERGRIRNIKDFVDRIPEAVHLRKTENIEPGASDDPVAKLFRRSDLPHHAWQKYALFDNNKPYTRNLISTDHETYTLLLLCWNPEQESPIHDHPCDGCWLQVLEGGVREVRYDRQLNRVSQNEYRRGGLSYITDNVGYHKVGNPTQTAAVTLHLYAPPFETCKCWHSDKANPSEPSEGKSVNHSEYGILKET